MAKQTQMFSGGEDLPLFSGTAPRGNIKPFKAEIKAQMHLIFIPMDWQELAKRRDKIIKPKRRRK